MNQKLMEDVKNFVKTKIKDVKCVDEIFLMSGFRIEKSDKPSSYQQLWRKKKTLQHAINIFNNYQFYKMFTIKKFDDSETMNTCYKFDNTSGTFECVDRPSEANIIDALFDYVECFLSVKTNEERDSVDVEAVKRDIMRCLFCEGSISDDKCELCTATINDMIQVKTPKKEPIPDNMDNNANINNEPIPGVDVIKDGNIAEIRETVAITKQNEDGTRWKCGKCECLNEYSLGNCEACGGVYKDGTWICGGCTMRNSCIDDACTTCYVLNDKLAVNMEDRKERCDKCGSVKSDGGKQCDKCNPINGDSEVWKDKWKCGKCGLFWGLEINICAGCGASKIGSGMWRCGTCTLENKWEDQKCTVCDAQNNNVGAKNCVSCKKNQAGPGKDRCVDCDKNTTNQYAGGKWQCKYSKCNEYNNNTDRYCGTCRLIRDYPRGRGDSVKLWYEDKEITLWVCFNCAQINKEHELVCHMCKETRYKKRFCKPCEVYNDGTTYSCDKCYKRLI